MTEKMRRVAELALELAVTDPDPNSILDLERQAAKAARDGNEAELDAVLTDLESRRAS